MYIATEDGSVGAKGNVLDAVKQEKVEADVIFACGPTPMLRAIKAYALENDIPYLCFSSLEVGMRGGTCLLYVNQLRLTTILRLRIRECARKVRYLMLRRGRTIMTTLILSINIARLV